MPFTHQNPTPAVHWTCNGTGRDSYVHLNNGGFTVYARQGQPNESDGRYDSLGTSVDASPVCLAHKVDHKAVRIFGEGAKLRSYVHRQRTKMASRIQNREMKRLATPKQINYKAAKKDSASIAGNNLFLRPSTVPKKGLVHSRSAPVLKKLHANSGRPSLTAYLIPTPKNPTLDPYLRTSIKALNATSSNGFPLPSYQPSNYNEHQINSQQNYRNHLAIRERPLSSLPTRSTAPLTNHPLLPDYNSTSFIRQPLQKSASSATLKSSPGKNKKAIASN